MKRAFLIFILSALILLSLLMWALNSGIPGNISEIIMMAGGLVVVGFAIYIGITRARSSFRKEPPEDELSRKIMTKASSLSFYISIYWLLFLMYISDRVPWQSHTLIGLGILGMALIFFFSWLWLKLSGLRNE